MSGDSFTNYQVQETWTKSFNEESKTSGAGNSKTVRFEVGACFPPLRSSVKMHRYVKFRNRVMWNSSNWRLTIQSSMPEKEFPESVHKMLIAAKMHEEQTIRWRYTSTVYVTNPFVRKFLEIVGPVIIFVLHSRPIHKNIILIRTGVK